MSTLTRKRFLASAAAVTASTVLVGDTAFAAKARTIAIQTPTTINYWYSGGGDALRIAHQVVDAFNKTHKTTHVQLTTITAGGGGGISTNQKLLAAITAGAPPDAAYIDRPTMSVPWGVQGALTPLDTYIEKDGLKADSYLAAAWNASVFNGHVYALPMEADPGGLLWWNKDLFEKAGLNPDQPPLYTDELDRYAARLTQKASGGKYKVLGFIPWAFQGYMYGWGWAWGGSFWDAARKSVTCDNPQNAAALTWQNTYAKTYDITKIDAYTQTFYTTQDPFALGQMAMIIDGVWRPATMKLYGPKVRYGVSYQPYPRHGGHKATYLVGEAIAIPHGAKNGDRAWEFIKWLSSGTGITQWCAGNGYLPAHKPALANPIFAQTDVQKTIRGIMDKYAEPIPSCPAANQYWDALTTAVDKVTHGKSTPQQALAEAQQTTQQAVDQFLMHYPGH